MKVTKSEIAEFIKDEVKFLMKNNQLGGSYLMLDDYYALVICWEKGFGKEKRDDVIQSKGNLDYALCYGIREVDSNSKFNNIQDWKFASNDDLGIECESVSLFNGDDAYYNQCAESVIEDYNSLNGVNESKVEEPKKSESKTKLDESTSNFAPMGNMPLLVFDILSVDYDENEGSDYTLLDDYQLEELRDRLDELNDYLDDKHYKVQDEIYDLEIESELSKEDEKKLDELYVLDGYLSDLHFELEDGYYEGCQIYTNNYKSFDKLPKGIQQEILKRLSEIKKEFALVELSVGSVFSNGEVWYNKVEEGKKSTKEGTKSLNESNKKFRDIVAKHFNYSGSFEFFDIVEDILSGIEDFNDEEALDFTLNVGDSLISYNDQWEVMKHYQVPSEASLDDAEDALFEDVKAICREIASGKNESLKPIKEDAKNGEEVNIDNVKRWLKTGGATIDTKTKKAINYKDGYEISFKGSEEKFYELNLDKDEDIQKVVDAIQLRLEKQNVDAVGLWVNNGVVYLDNSEHFIGSEEEALKKGDERGQESILRWKDMKFLDCGAKKKIVSSLETKAPIKETPIKKEVQPQLESLDNEEDDLSMFTQEFIDGLSKMQD